MEHRIEGRRLNLLLLGSSGDHCHLQFPFPLTDQAPANRHGLASCWIYRRHDKDGFGATMDPGQRPEVHFRFDSMADLVTAHREALNA